MNIGLHAEEVFLSEQFNSLEQWKPFYFPGIKTHTSYTAGNVDGRSCLIVSSNHSASALILKNRFNVYQYPDIAWRLQVSNIYQKGDSSKKEGDDYPVRIMIMFLYVPEQASMVEKLQYETAHLFYGEYPPQSSLNYIWANKEQVAPLIPATYSSRAMLIPMAAGQKHVGKWLEYRTNIVQDYKTAFGQDPPPLAVVGIMSDSDNTGESARAYIDFIKISGQGAAP